ncbi:SusF/SusE family outer membrane protein [Ekhidna sp. MALMAid0563]|uniref:SusF/SusE family outer membrane protein n=1 Tax=Ekhidna sp. MALMAid0563 TaxID=3143937 RepID=UPI0032E04D17
MKNALKSLSFLMVLGALIFISSCGSDDGGGIDIDDDGGGFAVSNGLYFAGLSSSSDTTIALAGELKETTVEGEGFSQLERTGHLSTFMYLEAGNYFFAEVDDQEVIAAYGGSATVVDTVKADNQTDDFGDIIDVELEENGAAINVSESGVYHVVYDQQESEGLIIKINSWGILGSGTDATDGDIDLTLDGAPSSEGVSWTATDVALYSGGSFKLRYNDSWKVDTREGFDGAPDAFDPSFGYVLFTNLGGTLEVPEIGGSDIGISEDGAYTVTLSISENGETSISLTKTGEVEPRPEFPEAMYLVGGATPYDWTEPGTGDNPDAALFHQLAGDGNDGVYWKISSLITGQGFKISAANWKDPNLGFGGVDSFDEEGVTVSDDGSGNMSIATDGMYMIVLDLRNDEVKVSISDVLVYGIGDAFGSWDEDKAEYLFTVDDVNKTVTSPALAANGNIRMYADHPWIPDWWNAEFRVADGAIDYRNNGGDQEAVAGTTGQVITLSFDDNTGTIESP